MIRVLLALLLLPSLQPAPLPSLQPTLSSMWPSMEPTMLPGGVRLSAGPSPFEGRLEVFYGDWGSVCDAGFDERDATVVCRELFNSTADEYYICAERNYTMLTVEDPIWLKDVSCAGNESSFGHCRNGGYGYTHGCSHNTSVCVSCWPPGVLVDANMKEAVDSWFDGGYGDIEAWNVSRVTDMTDLFRDRLFAGSLSAWDVSNVRRMDGMFYNSSFNGDISSWDVSKVQSFDVMFAFASAFEGGDIGRWDVTQATSMAGMFLFASRFDQSLGWTVPCSANATDMFLGARCEPYDCGASFDCSYEQAGCLHSTIADGGCDLYNNRERCFWDGGDCCPGDLCFGDVTTTLYPTCSVHPGSMVNLTADGVCDAENDNDACHHDGGDCSGDFDYECLNRTTVGDGKCDAANNFDKCINDGGDCCESLCYAFAEHPCGSQGYDCPAGGGEETCVIYDAGCGDDGIALGVVRDPIRCVLAARALCPTDAAVSFRIAEGDCTCCPNESQKQVEAGSVLVVETKCDELGPLLEVSDCALLTEPATPAALEVKFSATGAQLEISFDSDTDQAGFEGSFLCSSLILAAGVLTNAGCFWSDPRRLVVSLGPGSTILPGDSLILQAAVRAKCLFADCSCWTTSGGSYTVSAPDDPVQVQATLEAPLTVGSCNALTVSAAASTGGAGRALSFQWSLVSIEGGNCSVALVAPIVAGQTQSKLLLEPESIEPCAGAALTVAVVVKNFFGQNRTTAARVNVRSGALPTVQFVGGGAPTSIKASEKLTLRVLAGVAACDGATNEEAVLDYAWDGPASVRSDPRVYELNPSTLTAGDTLLVTVVVSDRDSTLNNTATKLVHVTASPVVASIKGGDRVVSAGRGLRLDGSDSVDPDGGTLTYAWDRGGILVSSAGPLLTLTSVDAGSYVYTLTVTSEGRAATASVTITVVDDAFLPAVSVSGVQGSKVNPSQRLVLQADVDTSLELNGSWAVEGGFSLALSLEDVALTPVDYKVSSSRSYFLVLAANSLVAGASYTCSFSVGEGSASLTFAANEAPFPGVVVAEPSSGTVLETAFTLSCSLWTDDDLPLKYAFSNARNDDLSLLTSLRELTLSPSYSGVYLPLGSNLVVARVADSLGAVGRASVTVAVAVPGDGSAGALRNATSLLFAAAEATGDSEAVFQVAQAAVSLLDLNTSSEEAGQRAALRATILTVVLDAARTMDATEDASDMQASACLQLTAAPSELTESSAGSVLTILELATNTSQDLGLSEATRTSMVGALSNLLKMEEKKQLELEAGSLIDAVARSSLVGGVVGEDPTSTCADSFCLRASRVASDELADHTFTSAPGAGPGVEMKVITEQGDIDVSVVEFAGERLNATFAAASVSRFNIDDQGSASDDDDDGRRLLSRSRQHQGRQRRRLTAASIYEVTLTSYAAVDYGLYNADSPSTVDCSVSASLETVTCADNVTTASVDCALYTELINPCAAAASCHTYDTSAGKWLVDATCKMTNFTVNTTTCECSLEEARSFEVTSSSEVVAREFVAPFKRNPLTNLAKTALVLYALLGLAVLLATAAFWGWYRDASQLESEAAELEKKKRGSQRELALKKQGEDASLKSRELAVQAYRDASQKKSEAAELAKKAVKEQSEREFAIQAMNDSLPPWAKRNVWHTFYDLVAEQHTVLGYVVAFDPLRSRPLRAFHLFVEYLWLFASEAVIFIIAFPDQGCDKFEIRSECLKKDNPYFPAVKACKWQEDKDPVCSMNADRGAAIVTQILLLMILSALLIPLSIVIAKIVDVVAAPLEKAAVVTPASIPTMRRSISVLSNSELEKAVCDKYLDMETRLEAGSRLALGGLKLRHDELKEATAQDPRRYNKALIKFERKHGIRRRFDLTWRQCFFKRETAEQRLLRKVRRRVRRNILRSDAWDEELIGRHEEREKKLLEFSRIERLTEVEQKIYLQREHAGGVSRVVEGTLGEDGDESFAVVVVEEEPLPPVTRMGKLLGFFALFVMAAFPVYYVLVAFAHIAATSSALSRAWLRSVLIFVACDLLVYQPMRIVFFGIYLPSLIKTKIVSLGNPAAEHADDADDFQFETPLFDGAILYLAARHRTLKTAPLILLGRRQSVDPTAGNQRRSSSLLRRGSTEQVQVASHHAHRSSRMLILWGAVVLLPQFLQDALIDEFVVALTGVLAIGLWNVSYVAVNGIFKLMTSIDGVSDKLAIAFVVIYALLVVVLIMLLFKALFLVKTEYKIIPDHLPNLPSWNDISSIMVAGNRIVTPRVSPMTDDDDDDDDDAREKQRERKQRERREAQQLRDHHHISSSESPSVTPRAPNVYLRPLEVSPGGTPTAEKEKTPLQFYPAQ